MIFSPAMKFFLYHSVASSVSLFLCLHLFQSSMKFKFSAKFPYIYLNFCCISSERLSFDRKWAWSSKIFSSFSLITWRVLTCSKLSFECWVIVNCKLQNLIICKNQLQIATHRSESGGQKKNVFISLLCLRAIFAWSSLAQCFPN